MPTRRLRTESLGNVNDEGSESDAVPNWSFKTLAFSRLAVAALWSVAVAAGGTFVYSSIANDSEHNQQCAATKELIEGLRRDVDGLHQEFNNYPSADDLKNCGGRVSRLEEYKENDNGAVDGMDARLHAMEAKVERLITLFHTMTNGKYGDQLFRLK